MYLLELFPSQPLGLVSSSLGFEQFGFYIPVKLFQANPISVDSVIVVVTNQFSVQRFDCVGYAFVHMLFQPLLYRFALGFKLLLTRPVNNAVFTPVTFPVYVGESQKVKRFFGSFKSPKWHNTAFVFCYFKTEFLQPFNQGMSMHLCKTGGDILWLKYPMLYINGFIGAVGILCISAVAPKLELTACIAKELIGVLGLQYLFMLIWDEYMGRDQHHAISFIGATGIYTLCLIINYFIAKYLPVAVGRSK